METLDVLPRLAELRRAHPALRLYALVDGAQYQIHRGDRLKPAAEVRSLFAGTPDAGLAHAGPWLVDTEHASAAVVHDLALLERQAPAVSWLITWTDFVGLAQLLQLHLDLVLPDGRTALLRYWDPRVLANLAELLEPVQREAMFGFVHEWHLLHRGRRIWIGRQHVALE